MHATRAAHPLFGPNRFKPGVFSANCDGGLTMSPPRLERAGIRAPATGL